MTTTNNSDKKELLQNLTTLLTEQIEGITLNELENVYKTKFDKSILAELIKLVFPNKLGNLFSITSDVIKFIDQESNEETGNQLIQQITTSGIVSEDFCYHINPIIYSQTKTFSAYVSNIDQREMLIYVQPECHLSWMQELTELLDGYYSHSQSEDLLVKHPCVGLACVSKYDEVYHRTLIRGDQSSKYVVQYVDIGLTMEIEKSEKQFKHLLNCFAEYYCMTIPCRLADIEFKLENSQMPLETYQALKSAFGSGGPFYVIPLYQTQNVFNVKIYDYYQQCLNTLLVEANLATEISTTTTVNLENNESHKNTDAETKTVDKSVGLLDEYDMTENEKYDEAALPLPDKSNSRYSNSSKQKNSHHNGKDFGRKSLPIKQSTAMNQHDPIRNNDLSSMKITVHQDVSKTSRLFTSAMKDALLSNNKYMNQPKVSSMTFSNSNRKIDDHSEWMCCSQSNKQSLWSSMEHRNALLKYIGRVYNQVTNMYRIFTQLKDIHGLDELDILNRLIINAKQRQQAQNSFNNWRDNSRINRRLQDLKIIFEYNSNFAPSNHPFIIDANGHERIIEGPNIKSYFDLGCGDGTITAEIGCRLGLSKTNIFGGDVFAVQNENITFIKLNENDSNIKLLDNQVDLVTSFVTFHHVSELQTILAELVRILRVGGYLIIREHDCENKQSLSAKYLNFVHAIMMIAGVGEFADSQHAKNDDYENWDKQKMDIIEYTKSIRYRSCSEWNKELNNVGFRHRATLRYGANGSENPQNLFYAVYRLETK